MATEEEIARLRRLVGATTLTDAELAAIIDGNTTFEGAIAEVWGNLAASYSTMTNVSEAGSSRSLGDLFKNAQAMATYWRGLADKEVEVDVGVGFSRTREIVRPEE